MSISRKLIDAAEKKNSTEFQNEFNSHIAELASEKVAQVRNEIASSALTENESIEDKED